MAPGAPSAAREVTQTRRGRLNTWIGRGPMTA